MTQQTKDEAREESLRRWHALPPAERQTTQQAQIFAAALAAELDFRTMANRRMVILGWLVRDLDGLPAWGNIPPESQPQPVREAAADEVTAGFIGPMLMSSPVESTGDNDNELNEPDLLWHAAE